MENLSIEPTKSSPAIVLDCEKHELSIKGESYPENAVKFYEPVLGWLEKYFKDIKSQNVTVNIELSYFNSISSKILMDIFDWMEESVAGGANNITVNWRYNEENEMALEYGEEFQEDMTGVKFNLVSFT